LAEVMFYHLTDSTLEEALPLLLERSVQRGWRAVVQCGGEERRDALDAHLWTYDDSSFLGHGTDREDHPEDQPVLLTTRPDANQNAAAVRFLVDGAELGGFEGHERWVFMFDGHDPSQVEAARLHWKQARADGHSVTYWQQTAGRKWERKA
jgi:DNA polymerase-3 subunit chi